jgi:hypothetical protein
MVWIARLRCAILFHDQIPGRKSTRSQAGRYFGPNVQNKNAPPRQERLSIRCRRALFVSARDIFPPKRGSPRSISIGKSSSFIPAIRHPETEKYTTRTSAIRTRRQNEKDVKTESQRCGCAMAKMDIIAKMRISSRSTTVPRPIRTFNVHSSSAREPAGPCANASFKAGTITRRVCKTVLKQATLRVARSLTQPGD